MLLLGAFIVVAALVALSPGPDTMLVLRSREQHGYRGAMLAVAGVISGLLIWGMLVAAKSALAIAFPQAASTLRVITGAAQVLAIIWSVHNGLQAASVGTPSRRGYRSAFVEGFVNNLLNQQVRLFYLGLLPVVDEPTGPLVTRDVTFAAVHIGESLVWLALIAIFGARLQPLAAIIGVLDLIRAGDKTPAQRLTSLRQWGQRLLKGQLGARTGSVGASPANGTPPLSGALPLSRALPLRSNQSA